MAILTFVNKKNTSLEPGRVCGAHRDTSDPVRWARRLNATWPVRVVPDGTPGLRETTARWLEYLEATDARRLVGACRLAVRMDEARRAINPACDPKPFFYCSLFAVATDEEADDWGLAENFRFTSALRGDTRVAAWVSGLGVKTRSLIGVRGIGGGNPQGHSSGDGGGGMTTGLSGLAGITAFRSMEMVRRAPAQDSRTSPSPSWARRERSAAAERADMSPAQACPVHDLPPPGHPSITPVLRLAKPLQRMVSYWEDSAAIS